MAATAATTSTTQADVAQIIQQADDPIGQLNEALTPEEKREFCDPNGPLEGDTSFWLLCNLVTRNWLDSKPTPWEVVPEHAMHWNEQVEANPLNIILSARKHTKTTFVLCKIIQKSQYIEGFASLYWANTQTQVHDRMGELDELIEANLWLDNLHEDGDACGGSESKTFLNGAKLFTTSVTGSPEGGHVNMSIGDDPLKEYGGIPDERIEAWYSKVVEPMLNREGIHIIVGTRKRPTDLYEILRTKNSDADWDLPSYQLLEYPAVRESWLQKYGDDRPDDLAPAEIYTEIEAPKLANALDIPGDTVSILWQDGRPANWLARKLGAQGYPYFVREFCMVFEQAANAIIDRASIDTYCSIHDVAPDYVDVANSLYTETVVGVDPASTAGTDRSSFVVLGIRESGVRDILHVYNDEAINPARFKTKLQELDRRYAPTAIVIESNGMQEYLVEDAIEFDRSLPIQRHNTSAQKHSWESGIPRMAHRITNGGYQFYRENADHTEELIDSLTSLVKNDEGKLEGHTPDPVSALYQAEQAIASKVPTGTIDLDDHGARPSADDVNDDPSCPRCGNDLEPANRKGMARCETCDVLLEKEIEKPSFEDSEIGQAITQIRNQMGGGGPFS